MTERRIQRGSWSDSDPRPRPALRKPPRRVRESVVFSRRIEPCGEHGHHRPDDHGWAAAVGQRRGVKLPFKARPAKLLWIKGVATTVDKARLASRRLGKLDSRKGISMPVLDDAGSNCSHREILVASSAGATRSTAESLARLRRPGPEICCSPRFERSAPAKRLSGARAVPCAARQVFHVTNLSPGQEGSSRNDEPDGYAVKLDFTVDFTVRSKGSRPP